MLDKLVEVNELLKKSRKKYKLFFDKSDTPSAFVSYIENPENEYEYYFVIVNRAFERLFSVKSSLIENHNIDEVFKDGLLVKFNSNVHKLIEPNTQNDDISFSYNALRFNISRKDPGINYITISVDISSFSIADQAIYGGLDYVSYKKEAVADIFLSYSGKGNIDLLESFSIDGSNDNAEFVLGRSEISLIGKTLYDIWPTQKEKIISKARKIRNNALIRIELFDPTINKWLKVQLIKLDVNRLLCMIRDVSLKVEKERKKEFRLNFENIINDISESFITMDYNETDTYIYNALKRIAESINSMRVDMGIISDNKKAVRILHEWKSPEAESIMDKQLLVNDYNEIVKFFSSNKYLLNNDIDTLFKHESNSIQAPGKCVLAVPLKKGNTFLGLLILQSQSFQIINVEIIMFLEIAANVLSSLISSITYSTALRSSEKKLKMAQFIAHLGYWDYNIEEDRFTWSDEVYRIFGMDSSFVSCSFDDFMSSVFKGDREGVRQQFQKFEKTQERFKAVCRIVTFNKEVKYIQLNCDIYYDNLSHGKKVFGTIMDVTEAKKVEKELLCAKKTAEDANRFKTAFLANMSHEIRTPMNGILGFTEILKNHRTSEEERIQFLNIIHNSGTQLLKIINDILDLSKIEAGQVKIHNTEFNFNKVMEEIFLFFQTQLESDKVDLKLTMPLEYDDAFIVSDELRFRQIMINFMGNAVKFTNKGFIELGYSMPDAGFVKFYVKDTGCGIPADRVEDVFKRFYMGEEISSKKHKGTGLGLAICKSYTELLGGDIGVHSKEGEGSEFYIYLKFLNSADNVRDKKERSKKEYNWKNKSILIVEDEESTVLFLKKIFNNSGADVYISEDGQDIETLILDKKIDIVLMDIRLPGSDGLSLTRQIKNKWPTLPVIIQTASVMDSYRDLSFKSGADGFIVKPIDMNLLNKTINSYLYKNE